MGQRQNSIARFLRLPRGDSPLVNPVPLTLLRQYGGAGDRVSQAIQHLARATEHLGRRGNIAAMQRYLEQPHVSIKSIEHMPSSLKPLLEEERKRRENGGKVLAVDVATYERAKPSSQQPPRSVTENENWG